MKRTIFLFLGISLFSLFCKNSPTSESGKEANRESKADSLYKLVIHLHDEAMPKMGKIIGFQKQAQQKLDSINLLATKKKDPQTLQLLLQLDSLLFQLKAAEKGMNDWMDAFDPDPKFESAVAEEAYWEDQQLKTQKMRDAIMDALDSANARLP